jgi:gas vesicle protein
MISEHEGAAHGGAGGAALAFLIGGILGAGVGLLMAPCSGEEARRKLGDAATRVAGKVRHNVADWKERAEDRLASATTESTPYQ